MFKLKTVSGHFAYLHACREIVMQRQRYPDLLMSDDRVGEFEVDEEMFEGLDLYGLVYERQAVGGGHTDPVNQPTGDRVRQCHVEPILLPR